MEKIIAYTDGGARGNQGPSGIGVSIQKENGTVLKEVSLFLGNATNNFAEYTAVVRALRLAIKNKVTEILLRSDSELLIRQLSGEYKVKSETLKPLYDECMKLIYKIKKIKFEHVRREFNIEADRLANEALDNLD